MKKIVLIGLGLVLTLALLVTGCATQPTTQPPQQQPPQQQPPPASNEFEVEIEDFKFQPAEITVTQGSTITWTNKDDVGHTVKFTFEESRLLGKGDSYSYTFNQKGTFDYECGPHPFMKGKVTVI